MTRTGSIASDVGPAVISTCLPASDFLVKPVPPAEIQKLLARLG